MKGLGKTLILLSAVAACLSLLIVCDATATSASPALSQQQKLKLGERIYREGILPNGEPLMAFVKGDLPVPGTAFTCISCHLRGGIGSIEGGVYTPPTNGKTLYQPLKKIHKGVEIKYGEDPFRRPAYTDETLAEVLRTGTDPVGKILDDVMPRYLLEDEDAPLLIAYLKSLSSEFSPGVTDTTLHFATIISEDANPADTEAMVSGIEKFITDKNGMANNYRNVRTPRDRMMAKAMSTSKELELRKLTLSRWILKGAPETWRRQLEEYNRREPAFALLGGLVNGDWQPIHQFTEENGIPCIFPNTDFPVISDTDWYTLYISKGFYQEGEAVARFLNSKEELLQDTRIIQIVRASREGRALSAGFEETWKTMSHNPPLTISLAKEEQLSDAMVSKLTAKEEPLIILVWDGPDSGRILTALANGKNKPTMVFASSSYLGKNLMTLPEQVRDFTYLSYPYRLPQDKVIDPMMGKAINFQVGDNRVAQQTYALVLTLNMAVMEIKGNYYRDHFLDAIGMSMDRVVPLYERLSFGPGQRYASKGCYIVQLAGGENPQLVKRSDWVTH
ncbi:ABC transporter substrate-binding protein [Pelotalea chapellei]|uniref:ABC transporter substrate-binding protein n=1 Tax=Pelotalea chapellei TaxID=44671 RepID=A0ABS5U5M6_9BACT|nr:ABC transporter substrate-binding protein [Pelotalea chapellei]MBT1070958.1 ABC transporter substrate-binding protein [Pelotalea chapellei]